MAMSILFGWDLAKIPKQSRPALMAHLFSSCSVQNVVVS